MGSQSEILLMAHVIILRWVFSLVHLIILTTFVSVCNVFWPDSVRAFKERHKLGRFREIDPEEQKRLDEEKAKKEQEEKEKAESMKIDNRYAKDIFHPINVIAIPVRCEPYHADVLIWTQQTHSGHIWGKLSFPACKWFSQYPPTRLILKGYEIIIIKKDQLAQFKWPPVCYPVFWSLFRKVAYCKRGKGLLQWSSYFLLEKNPVDRVAKHLTELLPFKFLL